MNNTTYTLISIGIIAAVTALTRFLPFVIFSGKRKTPEYILWLGRVLPYAIMGMLVVYCLKSVSLTAAPFGRPELVGCAAVVILHICKRNSIISIAGGTAIYMLIVNLI